MDTYFGHFIWSSEKERAIMKKKKKYDSDYEMPIGKLIEVPNFLPPPEELAVPDDTVKVTISLKKESVDFFKRQAAKHHTKYQRMIRELLDRYASRYIT